MNPTKGKLFLKFIVSKKSEIILVNDKKDPKKLSGDFYIEKIGKECDPDFQIGQKVTMREHYYYIPVELSKDDTAKGIYYCLVDQSEVWGIENV
jgi:hypothetical protein